MGGGGRGGQGGSGHKFMNNKFVFHESQNKYRMAQNFCGGLFLRIGDLLCFAGIFLWLGQIGFSHWELIFAIFRKYLVPSIDNILVFVKYVQ